MLRIVFCVLFFLASGAVLLVRGKSRPWPWIIVLAAVFASFYFLYEFYSLPLLIALGALFTILSISSRYDLSHRSLLTVHLVFIAAACIAVRFFLDIPVLHTVLSVACGFTVLAIPYLVSKKKWLGSGDIVVFSSFCLIVEPFSVPLLLLFGALLAILYHFFARFFHINSKKIPFIPFLSLSLFIYYPFQYTIGEILFHFR